MWLVRAVMWVYARREGWRSCAAAHQPLRACAPQSTREKGTLELKVKLDESLRTRTKGDEKFQSFVAEEIAAIKNALRKEEQVGPPLCPLRLVMCVFNFWGAPWSVRLTRARTTQVREREDDEIVETLNRYTLKLQQSLQIINSADT